MLGQVGGLYGFLEVFGALIVGILTAYTVQSKYADKILANILRYENKNKSIDK